MDVIGDVTEQREDTLFDEVMRRLDALAAQREHDRQELARIENLRRQAEERLRHALFELEETRHQLREAEKINLSLKKQLNIINFAPVTEEEERLRLKKKVRRLLKNIDESLKRLDE
jgi:chromosome segregation ATPase